MSFVEKLALKTQNLYKNNPNIRKKDIDKLQQWLATEQHLPKITEFQIICFFHSCYYDLKLTKTTIDTFFTLRTACPDMFEFLDKDAIKLSASIGTCVFLQDKNFNGVSAFYIKLLNTEYRNYNFLEQCNLIDKVMYLALYQIDYLPNDVKIVIDWKGLSFRHCTQFSLTGMKNFAFYSQNAVPWRVKQIHFVNVNSILKKIIGLAKSFIKKEIFDTLFFHKDATELINYIPQNIIPKDYGGLASPFSVLAAQVADLIIENSDVFESLEDQKVEEKKRSANSREK